MKRSTNTIIPKWVKELDISKCIPGRVYNVYKCRTCLLDHKADKVRNSRRVAKMIKGVSSIHTRCACPKRGSFLLKLKICAFCGTLVYGHTLSVGHCFNCYQDNKYKGKVLKDNKPVIPIPELKQFYRMGELVESSKDLQDLTKWNCLVRDECLKSTFKIGGSSVRLGCKKCPKYLPPSI